MSMPDKRSPNWFEWFPGHYFLQTPMPGVQVHVCARGDNSMHPVAIIDVDTKNAYYQECESLEEAQEKCEQRLVELAKNLIHAVAPEVSIVVV